MVTAPEEDPVLKKNEEIEENENDEEEEEIAPAGAGMSLKCCYIDHSCNLW